MIFTK